MIRPKFPIKSFPNLPYPTLIENFFLVKWGNGEISHTTSTQTQFSKKILTSFYPILCNHFLTFIRLFLPPHPQQNILLMTVSLFAWWCSSFRNLLHQIPLNCVKRKFEGVTRRFANSIPRNMYWPLNFQEISHPVIWLTENRRKRIFILPWTNIPNGLWNPKNSSLSTNRILIISFDFLTLDVSHSTLATLATPAQCDMATRVVKTFHRELKSRKGWNRRLSP
jgi:hypothetical protein